MDLTSRAEFINKKLAEYLPSDSDAFSLITEAMNYSVLSGGKRLRGIMLTESFRMFNQDPDMCEMLAYPFAAALECVHAYSLVHDDLPSMDNDRYRRGKLTTHAKYGHAMGVLTGDALLNYAMEIITDTQCRLNYYHNEYISEIYARTAAAAHRIFQCSGYSGMIGGQVLDVCGYPDSCKDSETDRVLKLYELKTSRLFQAALCSGAILAGAEAEQIEAMDRFGHDIGIAFQIKDDILDITSSLEVLGKEVGQDKQNNKHTIPEIMGLAAAEELACQLKESSLALLREQSSNTAFFEELADYMINREK